MSTPARHRRPVALTVAYLSTIVAANWAVQHLPIAHLDPWLTVPAGAWTAGVAFSLRDFLSKHGCGWVWSAIGLGAAISLFVAGPGLAIPSAAAFLFAELADWWLWRRLDKAGHPYWALGLSNTLGASVDTGIFLGLAVWAFHVPALTHVPVLHLTSGQLVGKLATTLPALAILWAIRRRRARRMPQLAVA